jgi:uncharacterized cupin superfamily protein
VSDEKWFKASLAGAEALSHPRLGLGYLFGEQQPLDRYRQVGVNVRVLEPGQPASLYHSEDAEEFFIVLGGECLAIVEDEEVSMRKWEFLHCPPHTPHVIVGAGSGPATVLMIGSRGAADPPHFPVSEAAARYGASVERETNDGQDAWQQAGLELAFDRAPLPWPPAD